MRIRNVRETLLHLTLDLATIIQKVQLLVLVPFCVQAAAENEAQLASRAVLSDRFLHRLGSGEGEGDVYLAAHLLVTVELVDSSTYGPAVLVSR